MPCMDYAESVSKRLEHNRLKERLDTATQNLCYLIGEFKRKGLWEEMKTERLSKWSKEHDENDTTRVSGTISQMIHKGIYDPAQIQKKLISEAEKVHDLSEYHVDWFLKMAEKGVRQNAKYIEDQINKKKLKKQALGKLSDEEKAILGIK